MARLKGVLNIAEFEGLDGAMRQSLELTGIDIQRIQHEPSNDIWATFDGRIIDGPVLQKNKDGRRYARCIVAVERSIRKKEGDQYVPYPPMEVAVTIWDAEDRTALADNESLFRFDKGLLSFEQLETDDGFKPGLSLDIEARNVYPAPEPKPGVTRALEGLLMKEPVPPASLDGRPDREPPVRPALASGDLELDEEATF